VITVPHFGVAELKRLKRQQAEELLMLGVRQDGETLVCARADGEPLQPQSLTHQFTRLINVTETMQSDAAERLDALFRTAITRSAGAK